MIRPLAMPTLGKCRGLAEAIKAKEAKTIKNFMLTVQMVTDN